MRVKRQWLNRLRGAHLASTQCQMVLDGRLPVSKSARRQSAITGVAVVAVYHQRLAVALAQEAICRAALLAIDGEIRLMNAVAALADVGAHPRTGARLDLVNMRH